ncbi:hypothetical protein [Ferrovibrio sp.]|uniref:cell division protein FtsL n=1 Tax=Ferrovibrio sp. TaxID=1917215 RepID=UPI0025B83FAF|nr:hypothetical protein [Ferrovibrio sp.]MBX3455789.1 hypothetical protein [Ferrovibrio sp.]
MSRTLSFIALLLLAVVSFGLYRLSYEVQRMEDELIELNRALARERETIGVLQAEWSYLSRPEYLQDKAERLLEMKPATARSIIRIEDLPWRQDRLSGPQGPLAVAPGSQALPVQAPLAQNQPGRPASEQMTAQVAAQTALPTSKAVSPIAAPVAVPAAASVSDDMDADVAAVLGAMRGEKKRAQ